MPCEHLHGMIGHSGPTSSKEIVDKPIHWQMQNSPRNGAKQRPNSFPVMDTADGSERQSAMLKNLDATVTPERNPGMSPVLRQQRQTPVCTINICLPHA